DCVCNYQRLFHYWPDPVFIRARPHARLRHPEGNGRQQWLCYASDLNPGLSVCPDWLLNRFSASTLVSERSGRRGPYHSLFTRPDSDTSVNHVADIVLLIALRGFLN